MIARGFKSLPLIPLTICLTASAAAATDWAYAPLALNKLSQVFPQVCIQTDEIKGKPFTTHGIEGVYKDALLLSGSTKLGHKWSLKLCPVVDSYSIWEADFDKNGEPDLGIITPTGGGGYACSSRVLFIMFDKNRTPRLFAGFSTGLGTEKPGKPGDKAVSTGIQDVCKSDTGDAVVVLRSVEHAGDRSYVEAANFLDPSLLSALQRRRTTYILSSTGLNRQP